MRRILLIAVAWGATSVAGASSTVTLYGIVDTGLGYNKIKGDVGVASLDASRIGMVNSVQNGSRWGLRGTEDLGSGLSAVFQLESGFSSANGTSSQGSRLFGRAATVGLRSTVLGTLEFGRQSNIASKYFATIDPFGLGFPPANIGTGFSAANTPRYDNFIVYRTPTFNGFEASVGYSFAPNSTDTAQTGFRTADNTRAISSGVRYADGPLNISLTYDQLNASNRLSQAQVRATPRQIILGGYYMFGDVKLSAAVSQTKDGWFVGQEGSGSPTIFGSYRFVDGFKAESYLLGLTVPVGASSSLFGSWQNVNPSNGRLTGGSETMNVFSVGATYDLSKRTNFYAYGSYGKDYGFIDGLKSTTAAVGIRHRF
ncbi:porin [Achromobacter sp. UMC71]|uniref:porin n=1 Tax=Achromobacter sp. UMC71 TaxID=1862320 RepID=UPI0016008642|nr:porin [Achromobacter sp. UMC71]MBB1628331.1 porin [Achromobacter sp. UMC71]